MTNIDVGPGMVGTIAALMFIIPLVLIAAFAVYAIRSRRRQRERLTAYAASRGWGYSPSGHHIAGHLGQDYPFGTGGKYSDVFTYICGPATGMSFQYSYTTTSGSGDNQSSETHYFHVVTLNLPAALPRLMLRRETMSDSVSKFFGRQDIQFESEAFNKAWLVQGDNLTAAHDIINPRMMEWLMHHSVRDAAFSIAGPRAITYVKDQQRTENIDALIARVYGFATQIPSFVWDKAR